MRVDGDAEMAGNEKRPPDASRVTVETASLPLPTASLRTSTEASRGFLIVDTEPRRPRSRTP